MTITVTTQRELDDALASDADVIHINSPAGVWLRLSTSGSATVRAYGSATLWASGSATVEAYGSATVRAYGSATVRASDSATVRASGSATVEASDSATVRAYDSATLWASDSATLWAYDSATVEAYDSATVEAYDSATVEASDSATVRASDSATVRAYGSATVRAYDSATVEAYDSATLWASGSATVEAYDSATVEASGSATVRAYGSATVRASDSATVEATPHVAVHLHSARAQISGGIVIDISALDLNNAQVWADHVGIEVVDHDGTPTAVLYKAVSPELIAGAEHGRPTTYEPGTEVTAGDWRDDHECGGGLHISPRPFQAKRYRRSESGTRFLKVAAPLAGLRPIGEDKAKSRTVRVLAEVDENGDELAAAGTEKTR